MMLNAEQIVEKKLLRLENSKGKPAQIGYDLSVKNVREVSRSGAVLVDRTELPQYTYISPIDVPVNKDGVWEMKHGFDLAPGYYELEFWEGCKIPNNYVGLIRQRSSVLRNGALIHSSVFDPGFETDSMGCFIAVFCPLFIERNARVAQMYFHECEPVAKGYDGQFQKDKQRK